MTRPGDTTRWTPFAAASALALLACSPGGKVDVAELTRTGDEPGVLFLTMDAVPGAQMEALYRGRVELDGDGCLRLQPPGSHTVVWPMGFELARDGGQLQVRDDEGRLLGPVGRRFRLSGGEVSTLHEGIPVSPEDRAAAQERCPGRYWIVGLEAEGIGQ